MRSGQNLTLADGHSKEASLRFSFILNGPSQVGLAGYVVTLTVSSTEPYWCYFLCLGYSFTCQLKLRWLKCGHRWCYSVYMGMTLSAHVQVFCLMLLVWYLSMQHRTRNALAYACTVLICCTYQPTSLRPLHHDEQYGILPVAMLH